MSVKYGIYTGNVIRDPEGGMWIVTDIHDYGDRPTIEAVAFDSENVSATQLLEDHEREKTCHCGDHPDFMGEPQEDCEDCHGRGHYVQHIKGWKRSKVLAPNVKEFILKGTKKAFGIR